jgi:O-6-methylguanine DNA methyltransferase
MKTIYYASAPSPLGTLWAAASETGLWAMDYAIDEARFRARCQKRGDVKLVVAPGAVRHYLDIELAMLNGTQKSFDLPIDWTGMTEFQMRVRQAVMAIPAGRTASYGEIAAKVGKPDAARAVGRVNATNPLLFAVPCHRVIGADGSLTGYGGVGGVDTKRKLLAIEAG